MLASALITAVAAFAGWIVAEVGNLRYEIGALRERAAVGESDGGAQDDILAEIRADIRELRADIQKLLEKR